eukprot:14822565-Ditylum_brightwellii.AAC.1
MEELGSKYLTKILKGSKFSSIYGATVQLTPTINNKKHTKATKERIHKCQVFHKMTIHNMQNSHKQ